MINFFAKRLNKKGFTLAEMLIVVAIIAILVAIAIPIFTAQLRKAQETAADANKRSVKVMAISEILDKWNDEDKHYGYVDADMKTGATRWFVSGTIYEKEGGRVEVTSIQIGPTPTVWDFSDEFYKEDSDAGTISVGVLITSSDIKIS